MKLLSTKEVTKIVGRSPTTLRRWWRSGAFPVPHIYRGKARGWNEEAVKKWLENESNG